MTQARFPNSIMDDEFQKLIRALKPKDIKGKVAFLLAYESGLRVSEVLNLTPKNFHNNLIEVPAGMYNVDRTVPLPRGWKDSLMMHIPIKLTARSLKSKFKSAAKKAGLNPAYSYHSLRRGFATKVK